MLAGSKRYDDATMPSPGQLNYARARYGIMPVRRPVGWSAMSEGEPKFIVGQFYTDIFVDIPIYGKKRFYIGLGVDDFGDPPSFPRWREHLGWAWKHDRRIRVIHVKRNAHSNDPEKFIARVDLVMRLMALDQVTGAYVALEEPAASRN